MTDLKPCKTCGNILQIRKTKPKAEQFRKAYYYTAYYFCTNCQKMYLSDEFKVENKTNPLFQNVVLQEKDFDVSIWTDGACSNNGRPNAKAAWAFVSGAYESADLVEGKQTNNTAESLAMFFALKWAAEKGYKKIRILSDSQISINNMKKPLALIKENRPIFEKIFGVISANNLQVSYEKVLGHSGEVNNERADKLCNGLVGIK